MGAFMIRFVDDSCDSDSDDGSLDDDGDGDTMLRTMKMAMMTAMRRRW